MAKYTIEEIKKKCLKPINGYIEVLITDKTSIYLVWLLANHLTKITPNMVSILGGSFIFICSYLFLQGSLILGVITYFIGFFLDAVDGKLARLTNNMSRMGLIYEVNFDLLRIFLPITALAFYYFHVTKDTSIFFWGLFGLYTSYYHMFYGMFTDYKIKLARENPNLRIIGEGETTKIVKKQEVIGRLRSWLNKRRLELQLIPTEQEFIFFVLFPMAAVIWGIEYIKFGFIAGSIIMFLYILTKYYIFYRRNKGIKYKRIND